MPGPFPNLPPEQRGTVHCLRHDSAVLADNPWGDPTSRDVHVYVPPGEHEALPAIFVLSGFAGTGEKLLARGLTEMSIATRCDRLVADGCPPFLAVLPDCMTTMGGSQYLDSPGLGNYGSYVVDELRAFVEGRFAVRGWGAVGRSSGGFGALHLAMNHPGALQAIGSSAGDMGFDLCYLGDLSPALSGVRRAGGLDGFVAWFWKQNRHNHTAFAAMNILAMACAYSPDVSASPIPAKLPLDFDTGAVDFDVLASWRASDPIVQVEDAAKQQALRDLELLFLDAGRFDEYHLQLGARRLVAKLEAFDVPHVYEEFDGGHRATSYRYDTLLTQVATALS